jgi:hypothetical protein
MTPLGDVDRITIAMSALAFDWLVHRMTVPALNRAGIFRPRAILNVVEMVIRGVPVEQAVVGQA